MPTLDRLTIQPTPDSLLASASLRHLGALSELTQIYISGLSNCTAKDLANLNGLPKLNNVTVSGDITDTALASLKGVPSLWSLTINTDNPVRRQTLADLEMRHPTADIRINERMKMPARPAAPPKRRRIDQACLTRPS